MNANSTATGALLAAEHVEVAYGSVAVLDDVSFAVHPGEIVALLGTNGAGKSTLLKTLSGILRARAGIVRFDGDDVTRARPAALVRRGLVQVPGGRATFPGLTLAENLHVGMATLAREDRHGRMEEAYARFGWMREQAGQLAGTLSGGQQQQLAMARALLVRPRVLMIDELSLGLSPVIVEQLIDVVFDLRAAGTAVVIVEQQVDLALAVADRAYFMERGQVRFEGVAADLRGRTDLLRAVFLAGADG